MLGYSSRVLKCLLSSKAIAGLCLALPVAAAVAQEPYRIMTDAGSLTVYTGNKPALRYRYAEVPYKPYVDLFYTPAGVNVLRDAPADHKHHHGLMFAMAADGINFWEEAQKSGLQAHAAINDLRVGVGGDIHYAGFVENLDWVDPNAKRVILFESRRLELIRGKDQRASLLTWESAITAPPDRKTVALSGSDYFGLGMRFVKSMDTGGRFVNAEGKTGVKDTHAARSRWCAYSAAVEGKPVTIAVFDHPTNPRQPATWFTMDQPFAYMAVTLNLSKQPLTLQQEKPLLVKYGVALWDGTTAPAEIESLYRRWVELTQPPPDAPAGPGPQGQPGR